MLLDQKTRSLMQHRFRDPTVVSRYDRESCRHRFEDGVRDSFDLASRDAGLKSNVEVSKLLCQHVNSDRAAKANCAGQSDPVCERNHLVTGSTLVWSLAIAEEVQGGVWKTCA